MRYKGSNLKRYVNENRGKYTEICEAMLGGKKKGLDNYYKDGRNIQINKLSQLLKATGMPLEFFVEFEPWELSSGSSTNGNSNSIINSIVGNDWSLKVDHLHEIIKLKDRIIEEQQKNNAMKDQEIDLWKKRYDDLIEFSKLKSDKNRT